MIDHCKKPCNECPFRKNSLPGWLSNYTVEELHSLVMEEVPFPCHITHEEDLQVNWLENKEERKPLLCSGALLYMKKSCKLPRRKDLAELVKSMNRKDCENILSIPDFFSYHSK